VQVKLGRPTAAAHSRFHAASLAEAARPEELDLQFRLRGVMGVATWVWLGLTGLVQPEPAIGAVSGSVSREALPGIAATPLLIWHQVRQIERALKLDLGVKPRLDVHRAQGVSPYFERIELRAELDGAIDAGDLDAFFPAMSLLCRNNAYRKANNADTETQMGQVVTEAPWDAFAFDLSESVQRFTAISAVAALAMRLATLNRWDAFDRLGARLAADPMLDGLAHLTARDAPLPEALMRVETALAPALAILFGPGPSCDPQWLLAASVRVWNWMKMSAFVDLLEAPVGRGVAERWHRQVTTGAFDLRKPSLSVSAILSAAERVEDCAGLARLILAALPSVALQLSSGDEAALREAAAGA
jgi:hypothetical protein